jgi:hypothetical protein
MKASAFVALPALLLAAGLAQGQALDVPEKIGPAPAPRAYAGDAAGAPMLAQPSNGGPFLDWYVAQKRPALVVYFDKELDSLPPGWRGSRRLTIEETGKIGNVEDKRRVTIGVERNETVNASARSEFVRLFEQSLQQEMKRASYRVLDGTVLHRRQAATRPGEGADLEYDSLKKSARFVFEVRLVKMSGVYELVGGLKDIHSGEIAASVRVELDENLETTANIDRASRRLVQRLSRQSAS